FQYGKKLLVWNYFRNPAPTVRPGPNRGSDMNDGPTPQQAEALIAQVEANQAQTSTNDARPLVLLLTTLTAGISVGLVAIGLVEDNTTPLFIFGAGLAWLIPALIVYTVKALSWSRRSTVLLLIWLLTIMLALFVGLIVDTVSSANWVPLATAGALWLAAPAFALLGLRR